MADSLITPEIRAMVGQEAFFPGTEAVEKGVIKRYAVAVGDLNPLYLDEEYARKTFFGGRIAHGVIALGLISAAMTKLPGIVIFLSASDKFLAPVRIGDTITARGEVIAVRKDKGIVTLKTSCSNQKGETVVEGEWTVRLYEAPS